MAFPDYPSKDSLVSKRHTTVCYFTHLLNPGEFKENGSTTSQPGQFHHSHDTAQGVVWQGHQELKEQGNGTCLLQAPGIQQQGLPQQGWPLPSRMEEREKLAAKSGLFPEWHFSNALHFTSFVQILGRTVRMGRRHAHHQAASLPDSNCLLTQIFYLGQATCFFLISLLEMYLSYSGCNSFPFQNKVIQKHHFGWLSWEISAQRFMIWQSANSL